METNSGTHTDTSQGFSAPGGHSTVMHCPLTFLPFLLWLLSVCAAVPVPMEVGTMKTKVKWMAERLLVRLNKDFQFPSGRTLNPAATDLNGLSSMVMVLDGYNNLISDTLSGVSQIKYDISSMTSYLDQWRQGHCSGQQSKRAVPGPLQKLQSQKAFIHTVSIEALMRVKEFLNLLLKNPDQLETC